MKRLSIRGAALPVVRGIAWAGAIPRGPGRGDLQNPTTGSAAHTVLAAVWDIVAPRLILQRHLVGRRFRRPVLRSQALCYVSPGAPAQPFHCDADGDRQYYTVIVPLTTERSAGGTEFGDGTCCRPVRGTAYYFDGAAVHRGAAHAGRRIRVYAAYVLCAHDGVDQNVFVDPVESAASNGSTKMQDAPDGPVLAVARHHRDGARGLHRELHGDGLA